MSGTARRYLIVSDVELHPDNVEVLSAVALSGARAEDGRRVGQPEIDPDAPVSGDIRAYFAGEPETHVEGTLALTKAGVVEGSRFSWVRADDDPEKDTQFRQSPHVCGRRVSVLTRQSGGAERVRQIRPKLLSLTAGPAAGDLLCAWMERDWQPVYGMTSGTAVDDASFWSRLDHVTGIWSQPVAFRDVGGFLVCLDLIQFPDTGEILLLRIVQTGNVSSRKLYVDHSIDGGATWTERSRTFFEGDFPDCLLDADGDGDVDDLTAFQCIAAELLPSDRIVAVALTTDYTWSLISDDRGKSWTAVKVGAIHGSSNRATGHGVGSTLARNGLAIFSIARRNIDDDIATVTVILTPNGVDFSAESSVALLGTVDAAITVSPTGFPHVYGSLHQTIDFELETSTRDWLWGRRFRTRDPQLDATQADLINWLGANIDHYAFHCHESGGSGAYTNDLAAPPIIYRGFVSLDAVLHRGQTFIAVQTERDDATFVTVNTQPPSESCALVIYQLEHWQPLQERLVDVREADGTPHPGYPAAGRIYNLTWDVYDYPEAWGWTRTSTAGVGPDIITATDDQNGYMQLGGFATNVYYSQSSLPNASGGMGAVVRFLLQVNLGGSLTANEIAVVLQFADGSSGAGVTIRFAQSGDNVTIRAYRTGGAQIGTDKTFTHTNWLEVIVATRDSGGETTFDAICFAREHDKAVDPDWDCPYTLVGEGSGLALVVGTDGLSWGHIASGGLNASQWKSFHVHRGPDASNGVYPYLAQIPIDFPDNDSNNDLSESGTGENRIDHGLYNLMRTSLTTAIPPQFLTRGVSASWRGEAITEGLFDYTSDYDFAAKNVLDLDPKKVWQIPENASTGTVVFDADPDGTTGRRFRPNALAVFGRNVPGILFEFHTANSWGSPALQVGYDWFGRAATPDGIRTTHIWAFKGDSASWDYAIESGTRRLTVYPPEGDGPWIPHQFRSQETGPKFYVVANGASASLNYIYRIEDNTEDTLTLATDVTIGDFATTAGETYAFNRDWAIFSDRFSHIFDHKWPTSQSIHGVSVPNSHQLGYRYMRITPIIATHRDADEAFTRIGTIILGHAIDLANPGPEEGWSRSVQSGAEVTTFDDGSKRSRRKHSPRNVVSMSWSQMMPPAEAAASNLSPGEAKVNGKRVWRDWLDAVKRLEVEGTVTALIWEGDRAYGAAGEGSTEQVTADPTDMMLVRVQEPGSIEHVAYVCKNMNLADGTESVPRPLCVVRGITFVEEL